MPLRRFSFRWIDGTCRSISVNVRRNCNDPLLVARRAILETYDAPCNVKFTVWEQGAAWNKRTCRT